MRKAAIRLMVISILAGTPLFVSAQQDDPAGRTQQTADREDDSEWGWLGLLGLVGLLGLKRRDRDRDHLTTHDRATAR